MSRSNKLGTAAHRLLDEFYGETCKGLGEIAFELHPSTVVIHRDQGGQDREEYARRFEAVGLVDLAWVVRKGTAILVSDVRRLRELEEV